MSTRIILIDREVPEHWDYAKRNGFWDLQKNWRGLGAGNAVYFWVTGSPGRIVGRARATGDKTPLLEGTPHAWSPGDRRRGDYHYRIDLAEFQDLDIEIDWGEVRDHAKAPGRLNPVTLIPDHGVSWLEQRLGLMIADPYQQALDGVSDDPESRIDVAGLGEDQRELVPRVVVIRRGRKAFRDALLRVYRRRCVVTGTNLEAILEAAHISSYKGDHTDRVDNGLLLRADIHTLFDLHLLTITASDYTVRLTPGLRSDPTYESLEGRQLEFESHQTAPSKGLLEQHNALCDWL
ncbi:HNH endonuclease [Intrasporangium oryzae]|nr:HNH endonuclease [Intrasporangium oryzae]